MKVEELQVPNRYFGIKEIFFNSIKNVYIAIYEDGTIKYTTNDKNWYDCTEDFALNLLKND